MERRKSTLKGDIEKLPEKQQKAIHQALAVYWQIERYAENEITLEQLEENLGEVLKEETNIR